jgi:uncharacterized protein
MSLPPLPWPHERATRAGSRAAQTAGERGPVLLQAAFQHARSGDAASLAALIDRGVPVDIRNHNGDGLLMLASYHGHVQATRVLLARGADPARANDRGQTPLAGAAFKGDVAMVTLLLDHGADVDGGGPDGKTALMFAAMFDRAEVVTLLLERGAAASRRDASGTSARDLARSMGAAGALARLDAHEGSVR